MLTKPKKAWYGVRTLYRLAAEGPPKSAGEYYDPESTLIEDRIVVFHAISFDNAIAQAIKEARSYCKRTRFVNIYGQKVRMRFLGAWDTFEMFDRKLGAGSEVYSSTALVRAAVSDSAVVKRRMGTQGSMPRQVRYKFIDGRILREALAAMELDNTPRKPLVAWRPLAT